MYGIVYKHDSGEETVVSTEDVERASANCQSYWLWYLQFAQMWAIFQSNELMSDETFSLKKDKYNGVKFSKDRLLVRRNSDGTGGKNEEFVLWICKSDFDSRSNLLVS